MKRLFALFCLCAALATFSVSHLIALPKVFPKAGVKDIMTLHPDSLQNGILRSMRAGDTVLLTGIVTVAPLLNYPTDKRINLSLGNGWMTYLRDTDVNFDEFAGIGVVQLDTVGSKTQFERMKAGDVVELLVRIGSYPQTGNPEMNNRFPMVAAMITGPEAAVVNTISTKKTIPPAIQVSLTDFIHGGAENLSLNYTSGAPRIGMKVELSDLIVIEISPVLILSDDAGNQIYMNDQSGYFTGRAHRIDDSEYRAPSIGQRLKTLRGYVTGYSFVGGNGNGGQTQIVQVFSIAPALPTDVVKDYFPPQVINLQRDSKNLFASSTETVKLNFDVAEGDNSVDRTKDIKVFYTTDGTTFKEATVIPSVYGYTGSIPPQPNGTIVGYKVTVVDEKLTPGSSPNVGVFLYKVVDGAARIADFQTPIWGYNGIFMLSGYSVTFEAVITADSTNIPGSGFQNPALITMQDSREAWSGFAVGNQVFTGSNYGVRRGDKVRITGEIQRYFGFTTLGRIDSLVILSRGNADDPVNVSSMDIGRKFIGDTTVEKWRAMLISVKNPVIIDTLAPANQQQQQQNSGEFSIADEDKKDNPDAYMRVETDDSPIYYTTRDSITMVTRRIKPQVGRKFDFIRGILWYGNQNYKLIPRSTDDFAGLVGVQEIAETVSNIHNYPNPFSNQTTLEFSVKTSGRATVELINSLGQSVRLLLSEELTAGNYRLPIDTQDVAAGAYSVLVTTKQSTQRHMVTIVR
ncbi:MAG: T9SS type A sorting domain-containing protein [Ignavibacteria bacterium]|nr:T9SS type A sorting domain-containing protein [Ignavibacteria bacterium]